MDQKFEHQAVKISCSQSPPQSQALPVLVSSEVPAASGENIHSSALVCNAESNPRELKPMIDGKLQNSPQLIACQPQYALTSDHHQSLATPKLNDSPLSADYSPSSTPRTPGSSSSFRCSPVRKLPALSPIAEVRSPHIVGAPVSPPPLTTPVFSSIPPLTNISPDGQAGSPDSAVSADPNAGPFTISQWQQLEKQALIFKYIVSGVSPPQDLVASLYASADTSKGPRESEQGEWMHPMRLDLEPDRCRRTDGKKWRCSREAVKDQKYCDRHMHRGRNRSRKTNENCTAGSNASIAAASSDGPASEVAGGINAATSSIAESGITQTRHIDEHAVVSASEHKNDSRCESSAQMGERSALPPLTLPPPVHPMGAAQVEPSSGLNSRATATSTWQTNPTTFQSQAQQEQHRMQHPPQDQQAVPHSGGLNQSINYSTSSRVQQYQLSGNLGPRFTSPFQPGQSLQVENTTPGAPSTSKSLGVSSSIVGLNSGPTQSGNHGTAGGQLQPGHYQIQHTPRAAIWERDGDDDTPGSSSRVPLLRLPNMLQRSASLQIGSSYSDKSHVGHHLSYAPAPVVTNSSSHPASTPVPGISTSRPAFLTRCSSVPEPRYSRAGGMMRSHSISEAPGKVVHAINPSYQSPVDLSRQVHETYQQQPQVHAANARQFQPHQPQQLQQQQQQQQFQQHQGQLHQHQQQQQQQSQQLPQQQNQLQQQQQQNQYQQEFQQIQYQQQGQYNQYQQQPQALQHKTQQQLQTPNQHYQHYQQNPQQQQQSSQPPLVQQTLQPQQPIPPQHHQLQNSQPQVQQQYPQQHQNQLQEIPAFQLSQQDNIFQDQQQDNLQMESVDIFLNVDRSQRLVAVCAARSPKSTDAAPARRPASAPFRLLSAPVAALPLVLAFVEAELPNAMDTFTALSDFHITEPAFKAFYMIFTCVFCWGALVFGSMNDEYYESDEYRNAGGNGTHTLAFTNPFLDCKTVLSHTPSLPAARPPPAALPSRAALPPFPPLPCCPTLICCPFSFDLPALLLSPHLLPSLPRCLSPRSGGRGGGGGQGGAVEGGVEEGDRGEGDGGEGAQGGREGGGARLTSVASREHCVGLALL
ncbi:unnamed protein product [Closterium sp. NIES-53]